MTVKRFYVAESNLIDGYCVFDREKKYAFNPQEKKENCMSTCKALNELHEENILLLRKNGVMEEEIECLSEEKEQLKAHNQYLIELLEHTGAIVEIKKGDVE